MTASLPNAADVLDVAVRWHDEAVELAAAGELREATDRVERALQQFERFRGSDCPDVANLLNTRGLIAWQQGDVQVARHAFERAARITRLPTQCLESRDATGDVHSTSMTDVPPTDVVRIHVQALNNLGQLERGLGHYDAAFPRFEEALRIARAFLGAFDLDTAMVLNSIGMWCKFTGRFQRGRAVYGEALAILHRAFGADHEEDAGQPLVATLYHNLGGLEHAAGEFAAAEPFARQSVEIRRRAVGPTHADYAADVGALAAIVADQGRCDEAEALYREALAIFERLYGTDHYEIAVLLHNLAAVEVARGRLDTAWDLYHRAAAMKRRWLGSDHPDLALTLHNLAALAEELGRRSEANTLGRQALTIMERNFVDTHPTLCACRELLTLLDDHGRAHEHNSRLEV